jgi:hypothetical protein
VDDQLDLRWISAETESKERDFQGIIDMHVKITRGILQRRGITRPYLYVDLYAGPNDLRFGEREFLGSPGLACDALRKYGVHYKAAFFEREALVAQRLGEALVAQRLGESLVRRYGETWRHLVHIGDCRDVLPAVLAGRPRDPAQFGLIYADPIHDEIPHALLNKAAATYPHVDLMSYFSATQYKRRRRGDERRNGHSIKPLVSSHIAAVRKKYVLIREPRTAWQFSFALWTNWEKFPAWERAGFYRLDSTRGQAILDKLDLTEDEYLVRFQQGLL